MADAINFIPRRQLDVLHYATQVHGVLTASEFNPATLGLTAGDVAELGTALADVQALTDGVQAARLEAMARTKALSVRGGAHERLVSKLRTIANVARASNAPEDAVTSIGVRRKKTKGKQRPAPTEAPEFSAEVAARSVLNIRFRTSGSAQPRARAANTIGIQVAVVDATGPHLEGQANTVPTLFFSSSPATVDSTGFPRQVRMYARWMTSRGLTGPWSAAVPVTVA